LRSAQWTCLGGGKKLLGPGGARNGIQNRVHVRNYRAEKEKKEARSVEKQGGQSLQTEEIERGRPESSLFKKEGGQGEKVLRATNHLLLPDPRGQREGVYREKGEIGAPKGQEIRKGPAASPRLIFRVEIENKDFQLLRRRPLHLIERARKPRLCAGKKKPSQKGTGGKFLSYITEFEKCT